MNERRSLEISAWQSRSVFCFRHSSAIFHPVYQRVLAIERGTGCIVGRQGWGESEKAFILTITSCLSCQILWKRFGGSDGVAEKQNKSTFFVFFSISCFFFPPFTSFQAESLLVRRKVWRGNVRRGGGGGGGEDDEEEEDGEEEREISHDRKQNDTHTLRRTHRLFTCVCVSASDGERERGCAS
ncbi:hypothetical protein GOODEAATRI_016732 [Goodea atripinnis]|uniref:Uncharacterized protein n=1 Tax=Goodea atripinnis TaxID=208336 RepID=A0ABV0N2B0_9TELE